MLNTELIPVRILGDIAKNMGWEPDGEEHIAVYLSRIAEMTPEQAFLRWCTWHGLHGWTARIIYVLDFLRAAEEG